MKIRAWKYQDILRISEMEKECFPSEPWSFQMLASSFDSDAFCGLLAEEGGDIIGYGGITVAADSADIENVAVSEPFRGAGVGKKLVKALCAVAEERGSNKVFLEVRVSNYVAMKLYIEQGFKGVYARTRYYSDGEDCLVMMKEIIR